MSLGGGQREKHMARKRSMSLAGLAIAALVGALGVVGASAAPPVQADATAVNHWNGLAANTLAAIPGPNGGAAPALQIRQPGGRWKAGDRATTAPALSTQQALWCEGVNRRGGRNGRI